MKISRKTWSSPIAANRHFTAHFPNIENDPDLRLVARHRIREAFRANDGRSLVQIVDDVGEELDQKFPQFKNAKELPVMKHDIENVATGEWYVDDKDYIRVRGDVLPGTCAVAKVCGRGGYSSKRANAAYIVHCVNHYDELVDILEEAEERGYFTIGAHVPEREREFNAKARALLEKVKP